MAALFPPWTNSALKLALAALALVVGGGLVGLMLYVRTPYITRQFSPVDQPVEFDHRHHVVDDEIDCLYCHSAAERSPYAGLPPTELCMGCHAQIWNESPLLEPVRRSYFSGQPIPWNRVHDTPEFVQFDHSVHVRAGMGCVHCHGRVDQMARVHQVAPLTMSWCLDCHRNPLARVGPKNEGLGSLWGAPLQPLEPEIAKGGRAVTRLTTCTACHR